METFSFGAEESKHDPRTIVSTDLVLGQAPPLQHKKDFVNLPHKNQLKVGICTAANVGGMAEKFFDTGWKASIEWLYKMGKVLIDGNTTEGSSIFTMLKTAQKFGIPSEAKFPSNCDRPYSEFMANTQITQSMLDDAAQHKIPGYAQVPLNPTSLMEAIYASKCGLATRMSVGNEWWTDTNGNITWDKAKLEPLRAPKAVISGHAINQIGYDAIGEFMLIDRNSWGDVWCDKGDIFFYMKTLTGYFTEAWTIVDKVLFAKDLKIGTTSDDVLRLQKFLNTHGYWVASTGDGSPGNETNYFGLKTFAAVKRLQASHNIPSTGYFGILTRTYVNSQL